MPFIRWDEKAGLQPGCASHLFDPDPCQDHDYLFKLPNALGRQDTQPRNRADVVMDGMWLFADSQGPILPFISSCRASVAVVRG